MSTNPEVQVQTQRDRRPSSGGYGKLIVAGVIGVVILILILQNTKESWRFHFFFWWLSLPAWLMLIVLLVGGFAIGFVLSAVLRQRKKREMRRQARNM
jgi:uncharacterized integral membrane protein